MNWNRTLYYTNLNSFNGSAGITDDHMRTYFEKTYKSFTNCIVDTVIDRYEYDVPLSKRTGWKRVIHACTEGKVDSIVVPSITMLSVAPGDILFITNDMKSKFNVEFCFICEGIFTYKEESRTELQSKLFILQEWIQMEKKKKTMRKIFHEITGISSDPCAESVSISYNLYEKAENLARWYGMTVRGLVSTLLAFITLPQNKAVFEDHILGIKPAKPMQPDRKKKKINEKEYNNAQRQKNNTH